MTRGSDQRIELELALFGLSEPPQQPQAVPVQAAPRAAAQPAAPQPFASATAVQPFASAPTPQPPIPSVPVVQPAAEPKPVKAEPSVPSEISVEQTYPSRPKSCRRCRRNRPCSRPECCLGTSLPRRPHSQLHPCRQSWNLFHSQNRPNLYPRLLQSLCRKSTGCRAGRDCAVSVLAAGGNSSCRKRSHALHLSAQVQGLL